MIRLKNETEIAAMREGGKMLATVLQRLAKEVQPDLTPADMAQVARRELRALGGEPAFLGFHGYPDVICISVNDQVQHAIPGKRPFAAGDVVNFDFGVKYKGMITDGGISVCVGGQASANAQRLLDGTSQALAAALKVVKAGAKVGDISATIERVLTDHRLGIVRELVGHGVGFELHEDPEIPNYGRAGQGPQLVAGMTIAIEPIANLGSQEIIADADGWTLWTKDGSWSAQFEHSILVTDSGCEILTQV